MHTCPKDGCSRNVTTDQLACPRHWYQVTKSTRSRVWRAWQSGNFDAHHEAVQAAIHEMNANPRA